VTSQANKYIKRYALACLANHPQLVDFYRSHGVEVSKDFYALSTLVQ
jgi:hypothetical protein